MKTSEREALQQQIDALQAKLDSLPKEPAFEPVIGWKPERDKRYYFAAEYGDIKALPWDDDGPDNEIYKSQPIAKTKKQAKYLASQRAARLRVLRFIELKNEGWVADFGDKDQYKHYVDYYHVGKCLCVGHDNAYQCHEIVEYCRTREIAKQVIEECGEDWKLWKGIKSA